MTLSERCKIHADKMDGEGWYVTANVLGEAAVEIERLVNKATEDIAEIAKLLKEGSDQRLEIQRLVEINEAQAAQLGNSYEEVARQQRLLSEMMQKYAKTLEHLAKN